jgi:hypothetical protein
MGTGWDAPEVYYAGMKDAEPEPRAMNMIEMDSFLYEFFRYVGNGYKIVGWNSLQFDLACIYEEEQHLELHNVYDVRSLVMEHIDPMFQIFCTLGWPVGLQAVSKGLGLPGKLQDGVSGADAPTMWMEGTNADRELILEYVGQDAKATLDIVEVGTRVEALRWRSKRGKLYSIPYITPLTCQECLDLPKKDNSWMDNPLHRDDFYEWAKRN